MAVHKNSSEEDYLDNLLNAVLNGYNEKQQEEINNDEDLLGEIEGDLFDGDISSMDELGFGEALDNDTERFIQDSLNAFRDKTMIVVAHRLSTIKSSDKIIVIDSHRIVEEGTHDELMKLNGAYASMYNA